MTFPFVGTHTESGWKEWGGQNHDIVDGGVTLATVDPLQYVSPTWLMAEPPLPFAVVDLDVDDCGDVWLLTTDGALRRYDPGREDLRRIHCTWDDPPADPRGIAVTADTVYVAVGDPADDGTLGDGDTASMRGGRIHAFSRHVMQTRWVADYTDPVAMARHGNDVFVLDGGDDATDPFLATIGRGGVATQMTTGFRSPVDLAVDDVGDRYVLDCDSDGNVPAIQRIQAGSTTVETVVPTEEFVTASTGTSLTPESLAAGDPVAPNHPGELLVGIEDALDGEHSLFRHQMASANFERLTTHTGPVEGLLLRHRVGPEAENRTGSKTKSETGVTNDSGSGTRAVSRDETSGLYLIGKDRTALWFLRATERNRLNPATGRYDAQVIQRLDSGEDTVKWHRLTSSLETSGIGTQVRIYVRATDEEGIAAPGHGTGSITSLTHITGIGPTIANRLRTAHVRDLWDLVDLPADRLAHLASTDEFTVSEGQAANWLSGAEDILDTVRDADDFGWQSVSQADPRDALLDDAVGRYLWVKAELIGTGSIAPRIDSLRAYFPRRSYLRYLPNIYRENGRSAAFLERYLSLFESVFTDVEEEIAAATRYFDPKGVPGDALSWLGGWLALSPDDTWATSDERTLVRKAPDLFKRRGTRRGLRDLLSIYLDDPVFPSHWRWALDQQRAAIDRRASAGELSTDDAEDLKGRLNRKLYVWESQDLSCIDEEAVRTPYEKLLPCPQCFAVMVWPFIGDDRLREVERLVDTTTPAHAIGTVIPLHPTLRLTGNEGDTGFNSFLGVNSVLIDRDFELGTSDLGTDTELTDREQAGQLGSTHRLGTDTRIS